MTDKTLTERIEELLGTPTGRQPSEPEMQRVIIVGARSVAPVGMEAAVMTDFAEIEQRLLALTGEEIDLSGVNDFWRRVYEPQPVEKRLYPVPEAGNRHERRRKAAEIRRKPPWKRPV